METSLATGAKSPAHGAYGTMAGIVISSYDKFLKSFQKTMQGAGESVTPEMLTGFFVEADRFANDCCERLGGLVRESSSQADVRETSEAVLTRIIRNRCFEQLDLILEAYLEFLSQVRSDLKMVFATLCDSRLRDLVKSKQGQEFGQKRFKLPVAAKAAALLKIVEYLRGLEPLSHELMDYGSMRLFGAEADFELLKRYMANVHASTSEALNSAIALIEELDAVKRKKWEEHSASESAAINAVAMVSSMKYQKRKSGFGALLIGAICTTPIWYVSATGSKNLYLGIAAGVFGLAAIFFFYRSVISFSRKLDHY